MKIKSVLALAALGTVLAACDGAGFGQIIKDDVTVDLGLSEHHSVSSMKAGIWIDGNGCEHWIIDDGIEGYMSPRWTAHGNPRCSSENVPFTTVNFNRSVWGSASKDNYN